MIEIDDLEDLFEDLSLDGPTTDQLYLMYGIFLDDFQKAPVSINGIQLKYNTNKSNHPVCRGKAQAFEHIITRESKYSGIRNFDPQRANKIHWIKPIIHNVNNSRIKFFEELNDSGQKQLFYWYEEKSYVVIIREIKPDYLLITSFCVDKEERFNLKKKYDLYLNEQKKTSLSK